MPASPVFLFLFFALLLSGCTQTYKLPEIKAPSAWNAVKKDGLIRQGKNKNTNTEYWWRQFNDPQLNSIMFKALENNYDLKIAQARIREAAASASYPSLLPTFSLQGNLSREGSQSGLSGIDAPDNLSSVGIAGNWDLDLNGRLRHGMAARDAILKRVAAEYDAALLNLMTQVCLTYLDIRYFQSLLTLIEKNIKLQEETLRVTDLQHQAGAIGKLDTTRAEAQLLHTKAKLPKISTSLNKAKHRLSILVAEPPGYISTKIQNRKPLYIIQKPLFLEAPLKILRNRPDVRIAEYSFQAAFENKNVRVAEIFPNISLSGFFGLGRSAIYGTSTPWSLGASLLGNLLDFGRLESGIDVADAQQEQALLLFKKRLLLALEDVENNLVTYSNEKESYKKYEQEVSRRHKAVNFARLQFNAGEVDFLNVLNEEERLLDAETAKLEAKYKSIYTMIQLHKSIGLPSLAGL